MPYRAALYARVSTTGHGQDVGLQLDELRQVAQQRGWLIVNEHVDDGISGTTRERPALDALMQGARLGHYDVVAIWKLDRLGRSLRHLLEIMDEFQELGVGFVSLRDSGMDSTTATGRLLIHVIAAFCAYEAELTKERVIAGVRRAQAKGIHCGRPVVTMDLRPALALLDQGHGLKRIAGMLNVSRSTLRARLTEAGHWPRRNGVENPASPLHP